MQCVLVYLHDLRAAMHTHIQDVFDIHSLVLFGSLCVRTSMFLLQTTVARDCVSMAGRTVSAQRGRGGRQPLQIVGNGARVMYCLLYLCGNVCTRTCLSSVWRDLG